MKFYIINGYNKRKSFLFYDSLWYSYVKYYFYAARSRKMYKLGDILHLCTIYSFWRGFLQVPDSSHSHANRRGSKRRIDAADDELPVSQSKA